jgi:hypothetical protein
LTITVPQGTPNLRIFSSRRCPIFRSALTIIDSDI